MPVILKGGCRVTEMREGTPVSEGTVKIWQQIGRSAGAHAISLRILQFAPGLSDGLRNGECDEVLYVLESGPGAEVLIDGSRHAIEPESGIYVRPGQTLAIANPDPTPVILVSSQCPEPTSPPEFVSAGSLSSAVGHSTDHAPIIRLADRKAVQTGDRWYRVLVDEEVGSKQVTQFVGSIPPGRAPDHFHTYEEVLFILRGEGRMWADDTNTPIRPGSCIYLPRKQVHCVENTGSDELRLFGVFYPAGSPSVRYNV
jgi:mannose-6-phosphate isomerase-like protein (cupin superfamily)